jgi:oxygen-independent coproporphyrinogen-3 oxidase
MIPAFQHIYTHVPFCARRCSYCDFSIAIRSVTPVTEFLTALTKELELRLTPSSTPLKTLYFGGGTPSRLGPIGITQAINTVRTFAPFAPDIELTIEANPDDITPDSAHAWAAAGVNRISLGIQSFNDDVLSWMHRTHTANQAKSAVQTLRHAGISNISIDLIFALPQELSRNWQSDIDQALALQPDHISLYGLTVEPHTPLARWRDRGAVHEASEEAYEADFLYAHAALTAAGFTHYEVSNYALPGRHSRHNSSYWSNTPYLGLGPSAHSFTGTTRFWNVAPYTQWLQRLQENSLPTADSETLSNENRNAERVYLGLRTTTGLSASDTELAIARSWTSQGWATIENGTIILTPLGWLRLDALATALTGAESR